MPVLEVTLARAAKIWWSILWRTWVLLIIPWTALVAVMFRAFSRYMTPPPPGAPAAAFGASHVPHLPRWLWLLSMIIFIAIQIFALRWALKARWSDFRLQAVSEAPQ